MIEARQGIRSQAIGEQMVSPNPLIENSQLPRTWVCLQALCQHVSPTVIAIGCGTVPIGDRVAKHHDCPCFGWGSYVNSGDEIPVLNGFNAAELRCGD